MNKTTIVASLVLGGMIPFAQADIINVPGDQSTIQGAINAASDGDEIVVAPGTYVESLNYGNLAITVRSSDGPQVTTLESDGGPLFVVIMGGLGPAALVGFMVTTGGNIAEGVSPGGSAKFIENCTFVGFIRVIENPGGEVTVTGSSFVNNGVMGQQYGGSAIYIGSSATVTIVDCTFIENAADFGTIQNNEGQLRITNSLFVANTALVGAAIYSTGLGVTTEIVNCTFVGNDAVITGGAMFNEEFSLPVVTNSLFWNNSDPAIYDDVSLTTVQYSLIDWPGTGNININPLFVDPDNGDFRLQAGSPSIDAGHNWGIAGISDTDLDGNPRFAADKNDFDPGCGIPVVVDMGAFEYQGDPFPVQLGDINGDGIVGINDFLDLLADWGSCTETCCLSDLNLDGNVGIVDFLELLANWTP